jgi:hypothetical protein
VSHMLEESSRRSSSNDIFSSTKITASDTTGNGANESDASPMPFVVGRSSLQSMILALLSVGMNSHA